MNHETYIAAIADIAAAQLAAAEGDRVRAIKLCYGAGPSGIRGVTYYNRWNTGAASVPFVEISAFNQSSVCQVAGTVLHELGHVLAGFGAGHGKPWHEACGRLGLRRVLAAGTNYVWANFAPCLRERILALPMPKDGTPIGLALPAGMLPKLKTCGAGIGTRGGKSRGAGSGSRLRLFECGCEHPIKIRVARDTLNITCNDCSTDFQRKA